MKGIFFPRDADVEEEALIPAHRRDFISWLENFKGTGPLRKRIRHFKFSPEEIARMRNALANSLTLKKEAQQEIL